MTIRKMSKITLNSAQMWDIDRYLLDDETLDRDAFEARMLQDETLALAVADELERLQLLSSVADRKLVRAAPFAVETSVSPVSFTRTRPPVMAWAALVIAVSLLFALFVWPQGDQPSAEGQLAANPLQEAIPLQEVAQEWLALESALEDSEIAELVAGAEVNARDTFNLTDDLEEANGDDWMLLACEFLSDADI